MYCKHCGKEIDDTSTFCQHCGKKINDINLQKSTPTKIVTPQKTIVNTKKNENRRTCLQLVIASLALLAIIITIFSIIIHNTGIDFDNITLKQPPELKKRNNSNPNKNNLQCILPRQLQNCRSYIAII